MGDIDTIKKIALRAGEIVMEYYGKKYEVKEKSDIKGKSPCTVADEQSNEFIVNELKKKFPADAILSEESVDDLSRLRHRRVWLVDPLDGTRDFIAGTVDFSIMIGLVVDGGPVLGVVFAPARDELYWAEKEKGAFLQQNGVTRQIRVRQEQAWEKLILVTRNTKDERKEDALVHELGIQNMLPAGSVGVKLGLIASGQADIHINTNFLAREWDTCAPEIILKEAGGVITNLKGDTLIYNKQETQHKYSFVASNTQSLHEKVLKKIKTIAKKHKLF